MNPYNLTWQTRLLFWLLSKRPDVTGIRLRSEVDHLYHCYSKTR